MLRVSCARFFCVSENNHNKGDDIVNDVEVRLIKLSRQGDRHAFAELVNLYKDKIYFLAYRMMNNVQEAEDVVQETFLRVYMNLHRYDDTHKFSTWIFRIATNLCIDRLRKRKTVYSLDSRMNEDDDNDWYSLLQGDTDVPEKELVISETQEEVRKAIDELPEKYKSIVILRYLHDLSLQEIGDILNMPISTIKTRVHRGREFLRKKLQKD